jgi:mono/diheme cytochrome c family protein
VQHKPDVALTVFWASAGLVIVILAAIVLLWAYDVIKIPFPTNMENQVSTAYLQGPRLAAPPEAVPIQGPVLINGEPASEPLPATADSLQRGQVLFNINCMMCHGAQGQGNGPLAGFFTPGPADLTSSDVQNLPPQQIFLVITEGKGIMPSIAENLSPSERWDVINYVLSLNK